MSLIRTLHRSLSVNVLIKKKPLFFSAKNRTVHATRVVQYQGAGRWEGVQQVGKDDRSGQLSAERKRKRAVRR